MKRRTGSGCRLPALTLVRFFLVGIVLLGSLTENSLGWIAGPTLRTVKNHRLELSRWSSPVHSSASSSALSATCRICRKSYDPQSNDAFSCVFHPGSLRGESPRKSDWEDEDYDAEGVHKTGKQKSIDNSQLVYTYTCCGGAPESEGCCKGKCKSFDDP